MKQSSTSTNHSPKPSQGPTRCDQIMLNCVIITIIAASAICIDRQFTAHVDISGPINHAYTSILSALWARVDAPGSPSYDEIVTFDPFIDNIFNRSKTMIFMTHHTTTIYPGQMHLCDELEKLKGKIVTLVSYKNLSLATSEHTGYAHPHGRIPNIYIKDVKHVRIFDEIIGDITANCGECDTAAQLFCEIKKDSDIYSYFAPGLSSDTIINTVFTSYRHYLSAEWSANYDRSKRKCRGYSVSDINGYYFSIPGMQLVQGSYTSRITHASTQLYKINEERASHRQCFINIELM